MQVIRVGVKTSDTRENCSTVRASVQSEKAKQITTSLNVVTGLNPLFSANANGTVSSASANARIAYCSMPAYARVCFEVFKVYLRVFS